MTGLSVLAPDGTPMGRSSLSLKLQEYFSGLETHVTKVESQLWQLMELRPDAKARYCEQWRAAARRLEEEALKDTGLAVQIHVPAWITLCEMKPNRKETNECDEQRVPGHAGHAAQGAHGL
ncbi:MAG TPA: hypothetical protein VGD41_18715 [Pyrinomonadaceae bacterium]